MERMTSQASNAPGRPDVTGFYEPRTGSIQYVVADPATRRCAVVDPIFDYDEKSGATATRSADALLRHIEANRLQLDWILDTHPHADHLSAADYLKRQTGAPTAIGARVVEMQALWRDIYNLPASFKTDGSQWDHLFADGEHFRLGEIDVRVMLSPGHTSASITFVAGDAALVHDTLFMPDSGTARADFPGGKAVELWCSIQGILALPPSTRVFTGHDYRPGGRKAAWESTVGAQRATNIHLVQAPTEAAFVALRQGKDLELPMPNLILHALQVNIAAGSLPKPEANGRCYLKIPLDALPGACWPAA